MKFNKLLGQHFLHNQEILKCIANTVDLSNKEVLEIGPGTGNLTTHLSYCKSLTLLEKDNRFASHLKGYNVIWQDALRFTSYDEYDMIIGNLPYNISQELIIQLLLYAGNFDMIFLIQKEVADKFFALTLPGLLSRINYRCEVVAQVGPHNFTPRPKVNSSVLYFQKMHQIPIKNLVQPIKKLLECPKQKLREKWPAHYHMRIHQIPIEDIMQYVLSAEFNLN